MKTIAFAAFVVVIAFTTISASFALQSELPPYEQIYLSKAQAADARLTKQLAMLQDATNGEERAGLKEPVHQALKDSFEARLRRHESNLEKLRAQVNAMEKLIADRRHRADSIVERRHDLILKAAEAGDLDSRIEIDRLWEFMPDQSQIVPPKVLQPNNSTIVALTGVESASLEDPLAKQKKRISVIKILHSLQPRDPDRAKLVDKLSAAELAKCSTKKKQTGDGTAWILFDPDGRKLREIVDTDNDNIVDTWIYFRDGKEIVREYQKTSPEGAEVSISKPEQLLIYRRKAAEVAKIAADAAYQIGTNDLIGVFVEGVLGSGEPTITSSNHRSFHPFTGYPFLVGENGLLSLPLIEPVKVGGKTAVEARQAIVDAYSSGHNPILKADEIASLEMITKHKMARVAFKIDAGDVLGIFIDGMVGESGSDPPIRAFSNVNYPCFGFPIAVSQNGTITLPKIAPIKVQYKTINEIRKLLVEAYTSGDEPLLGSDARIMVSLFSQKNFSQNAADRSQKQFEHAQNNVKEQSNDSRK